MLVTADHGNAERMIDEEGNPVTKHTTFRGTNLKNDFIKEIFIVHAF